MDIFATCTSLTDGSEIGFGEDNGDAGRLTCEVFLGAGTCHANLNLKVFDISFGSYLEAYKCRFAHTLTNEGIHLLLAARVADGSYSIGLSITIVHHGRGILIVVEPAPIGIEAGGEVVGIVSSVMLGGEETAFELRFIHSIMDVTCYARTVDALLGSELLEQDVALETVERHTERTRHRVVAHVLVLSLVEVVDSKSERALGRIHGLNAREIGSEFHCLDLTVSDDRIAVNRVGVGNTFDGTKHVETRDCHGSIVAHLQREIERSLIDHEVLLKRSSFEREVILGKIITVEDGFDTGGIVFAVVGPLITARLHETREARHTLFQGAHCLAGALLMVGIADVERTRLSRDGERHIERDGVPILRNTLSSTFCEVFTIEIAAHPNAKSIDIEFGGKCSTDFTEFIALEHFHLVGRKKDGSTGPSVLLSGDIGEIFVSRRGERSHLALAITYMEARCLSIAHPDKGEQCG